MVSGRRPFASINFITAHDGFTLNDLVSYNEKHNEANGENNQDGESHNESWNCGVEGTTDDPEIRALREQQKRNFLATLFLSQGVPMLLSGDEYGRTQAGNNNVYCQDNEISWYDWDWTDEQRKLQEFCCQLITLRKESHIFSRRKFFHGRDIRGRGITDIRWLSPSGQDMSEEEWTRSFVRCLGMLLNGEEMNEYDEKGRRITDDVYLLMVNSYWEEVVFNLPDQSKRPEVGTGAGYLRRGFCRRCDRRVVCASRRGRWCCFGRSSRLRRINLPRGGSFDFALLVQLHFLEALFKIEGMGGPR